MVKLTVFDPGLADSVQNMTSWQQSWSGAPVVRSWNFHQNDETELHIFTNCDSVDVTLNDSLAGVYYTSNYPARVVKESILFRQGTLAAKGYFTDESGKVIICSDTLRTSGKPVRISMRPDKRTLLPDGRDVVHIETRVEDAYGVTNPTSNHLIHYDLTGPAQIRVIDNGDMADHTPHGSKARRVHRGQQLLVIQSTFEPGDIIIKARAEGLKEATLELRSEPTED